MVPWGEATTDAMEESQASPREGRQHEVTKTRQVKKSMWLFWLALLIAIAFGCSFLAPSSGLHASALRALEASVSELSR